MLWSAKIILPGPKKPDLDSVTWRGQTDAGALVTFGAEVGIEAGVTVGYGVLVDNTDVGK